MIYNIFIDFLLTLDTIMAKDPFDLTGIPEEELLRQQEAMFAQARVEQAQEEWMQMQQTLQQQQGGMQALPQRFDNSQAAPTHASSMLDNSTTAPKETQNVTPNSITTSVIKEPGRIQPAFANNT